jgi:hypothetical protein
VITVSSLQIPQLEGVHQFAVWTHYGTAKLGTVCMLHQLLHPRPVYLLARVWASILWREYIQMSVITYLFPNKALTRLADTRCSRKLKKQNKSKRYAAFHANTLCKGGKPREERSSIVVSLLGVLSLYHQHKYHLATAHPDALSSRPYPTTGCVSCRSYT